MIRNLEAGEESKFPDRVIADWKKPLRSIVRSVRLLGLRARSQAVLHFGRNVAFGRGCIFLSPEFAKFGDNVRVGSHLHCETNLDVGEDTLISSHVALIANDHKFEKRGTTVFFQGRNPPVTITLEGDNLLGFGVTIVGNVRIGRGCIVGARAVVTGDLPPDTVCVGIPARPIRERYSKEPLDEKSLLSFRQ